jgi:hypothetical protein
MTRDLVITGMRVAGATARGVVAHLWMVDQADGGSGARKRARCGFLTTRLVFTLSMDQLQRNALARCRRCFAPRKGD